MSRYVNKLEIETPPLFYTTEEFLAFCDELELVPSFMCTREMIDTWRANLHSQYASIACNEIQKDVARTFIEHWTVNNRRRNRRLFDESTQLELF